MTNISVTKPYQKRRRYSKELKARIVAECLKPGASVSRISLDNGLNANMVRLWVSERGVDSLRFSSLKDRPSVLGESEICQSKTEEKHAHSPVVNCRRTAIRYEP